MSVEAAKTPDQNQGNLQPVESANPVTGKKRHKKLKVYHLSALTRQIILERFAVLRDPDDVADALELPGITGKTVTNVVMDACLPVQFRRPPASVNRNLSFAGASGVLRRQAA